MMLCLWLITPYCIKADVVACDLRQHLRPERSYLQKMRCVRMPFLLEYALVLDSGTPAPGADTDEGKNDPVEVNDVEELQEPAAKRPKKRKGKSKKTPTWE